MNILRSPWLLIILILLIPVLIATINSYRRFDLEAMWSGLIIAGIAFILFGIMGNMVSYMSEKPGSTFMTMNLLFVASNIFLLTLHGIKYYKDNYEEKPFEYYNDFFIPKDTASGTYASVKRSCVMELKERTRGQIANISSFSMDEVCDSTKKTCYYTCQIMYHSGEIGDYRNGFICHYILDTTFQIVNKEELDLSNYSYGDSEIWDSLIRQEVKSTLDMGKSLKLVDSLFEESNFEEYLKKIELLKEVAKEKGID